MALTALRVLARTAFVLSTAAIMSISCSRQGEGDRCDYEWAGPDQDCQADLICTPCGALQDGTVDRCCRRDATYSDPRCAPSAAPNGNTCSLHSMLNGGPSTGGSTSTAPTAGAPDEPTDSTGGTGGTAAASTGGSTSTSGGTSGASGDGAGTSDSPGN